MSTRTDVSRERVDLLPVEFVECRAVNFPIHARYSFHDVGVRFFRAATRTQTVFWRATGKYDSRVVAPRKNDLASFRWIAAAPLSPDLPPRPRGETAGRNGTGQANGR